MYRSCSAAPEDIADGAEEIIQWKKDGATIKLFPVAEAIRLFVED